MAGGPSQLNLEEEQLQVQLVHQPATCRPSSSANHRLADNFDQMHFAPYVEMQHQHPLVQQQQSQQVMPSGELQNAIKQSYLSQNQIISMTPRLKTSEQRSPMMLFGARAESKKAVSYIEPQEELEFVIEHNNDNHQQALHGHGMGEQQVDQPQYDEVQDQVLYYPQGVVDQTGRTQAPKMPARNDPYAPQFQPCLEPLASDFQQKNLHHEAGFESGLTKSFQHVSMPVQNLLFSSLAPASAAQYLPPQQLQADFVNRGSFDHQDCMEMTPQAYNSSYNRKFSAQQNSPFPISSYNMVGAAPEQNQVEQAGGHQAVDLHNMYGNDPSVDL